MKFYAPRYCVHEGESLIGYYWFYSKANKVRNKYNADPFNQRVGLYATIEKQKHRRVRFKIVKEFC